MIQTPRSSQEHADLLFYVFVGILWLAPGLALLAATVLSGGVPHTHVVDWPFTAIRSMSQDQGRLVPWHWMGAPVVRSSSLFWASLIGVVVPVVGGSLIAMVLLRGGIPSVFPQLSQPRARSRWASAAALGRAGLVVGGGSWRRRRVVLGRHGGRWIAAREGVSVLAFGTAGSGKSAGLCAPAIEEWDGCVIAVSHKTDLIELAAGVRQHRGRVDVLDPGMRTGMATCTWSAVEPHLSFDDTLRLVAPMVTGTGGIEEATRQVVTCALYCAANLGMGVATAVGWLDDLSGETLVRALLQITDRDPRATSWATRIVERGRHERAACFAASRELLRAYFHQASRGLAPPAFRPDEFMSGVANTLFVVAPTERPPAPDILHSLLRSLVVEAQRPKAQRPLLVVLDGGASAAGLERLGGFLAGRHSAVTVLATFRDLEECESLHGADAEQFIWRARSVMFLGGSSDPGTLDLMHRLVSRQVMGRDRKLALEASAMDGEQDLLPPEVGRQLGAGRGLLLYGRLRPAVLWMRNCYEDPDLVERHREHPFVRGVACVR